MGLAITILVLSLVMFWPGFTQPDTNYQYEQALTGKVNDWNPPAMTRLWQALLIFGHGSGSIYTLQMSMYWLGLGLLAQALGGRKALAILAIGAFPALLGWEVVVLKDTQFVAALAATTGLIGIFRLTGRRVPWPALLGAGLFFTYATLVRSNAVFSSVPLAIMLLPQALSRYVRLGAILLAIPLTIVASQWVNHAILRATESEVGRSPPTYDLAAIAVKTGDTSTGFTPSAIETLRANHCVKAFFWDPLKWQPKCAVPVRDLANRKVGDLYRDWTGAVIQHPLAYAEHRIAHLNSTLRWLVSSNLPFAEPPRGGYAVTPLNLVSPCCLYVARWQKLAGLFNKTPIGWPIVWLVVACWGVCATSCRSPDKADSFALALFISAIVQEASFAVISVSSDLRYHLWVMLAVALGWVILWRDRRDLTPCRPIQLVLVLVVVSGIAARLTLTG